MHSVTKHIQRKTCGHQFHKLIEDYVL
uniref:Uncharacterized protein n=1 Tax=Arundo donax TaxID=35708 RepID=A0A0A8ZVM4_ARUDO